jgi:hypothetical protein
MAEGSWIRVAYGRAIPELSWQEEKGINIVVHGWDYLCLG